MALTGWTGVMSITGHGGRPADKMLIALENEEVAGRFGTRLGQCLRPGMVILLEGPVGAGKSHLARAAIRALLGRAAEVPSPTFTLVQTYQAPEFEIWHADLYRLTHADEVEELGLAEAMGREVVLIEWPDRLGPYRPKAAVELALSYDGEGRQLQVSGADAALLACLAGWEQP